MNTIGLINKIEDILYKKLPNFNIEADVRKWRLGGGEYIKIGISASTYEINGVAKQYPQYVTLMLDLKTLVLNPFPFGGMGGGSIHLVPNSAEPSERYLAIKSIKVPFRKPQPNEKAVLSAIERFAENYLKLLQQYRDRLTQQAFVDYDKLLGPKMKKGGVMSKTKDKKTMAKGGEIKNQYLGKSPKEVYEMWDYGQKYEFFKDHFENIGAYTHGEYKRLPSKKYDELDEISKNMLKTHIMGGQYAKGGVTEHGLRKGDTITDDMFWSNEAVVRDSQGIKHKVNLEKGKRYAKGGMAKGRTMAKGGSLRAIAKKYEKNVDENMHSENVVLLAKNFGTADELKQAKQILATHEKEGSLSTENGAKRRELSLKLIAKARTEMAKEGIKFSKGGKMAKGGNTDVLLIAYGDSDYDNKIGHFTSKKMAKHFAKQNVDKYGTIMFEDFYGDTIVVNKGDTNEDIDWLFSDNMAKGGLLGGFNYSIGGL